MNEINIICRLNPDDEYSITEKFHSVNLSNKEKCDFTFWAKAKKFEFQNFFSNEALDLFYLSHFVYYADKVIQRSLFEDSWTRTITLHVPVLSITRMKKIKRQLEGMLSFLSGDIWELNFRKRELNKEETKTKRQIKPLINSEIIPDIICMFSGGLDSFIGAIDILSATKNVNFVSHYGGGKSAKPYQDLLKNKLISRFNIDESQFYSFCFVPKIKNIQKENTERTRSFLFFSYAILLASSYDRNIELMIPENGLISLNIPLTHARLGSNSTRTTHPYYIESLQSVINSLDIKVTLSNHYQFKTKGEMLVECKDLEFASKNLSNTMSCSHSDNSRYAGENQSKHCGYCLPCVIRRAAIKKAGFNFNEGYKDKSFKSGNASLHNLYSFKLAINKFAENESHYFLTVNESGPIRNHLDDFISVYKRGMNEVKGFIETIK